MASSNLYKYSEHAKYQKRRRSISNEEIEACLSNHDTIHTDKKGNLVYRARLVGGRGIKVVVAKDDPNYVITVADY
ncbi:DUF4258 domain-containing protein [Chloroflexota bacterium]